MDSDDELDEALEMRKLSHNGIKFFDNAHPDYAQYFALYKNTVDLYSVASDLVSQIEIRRTKDQAIQSESVQTAYGEALRADESKSRPASQLQSGKPRVQPAETAPNSGQKKAPLNGVKQFLDNFFD